MTDTACQKRDCGHFFELEERRLRTAFFGAVSGIQCSTAIAWTIAYQAGGWPQINLDAGAPLRYTDHILHVRCIPWYRRCCGAAEVWPACPE